MEQLLQPGWWFAFAGDILPWYVACLLCSVAALPLCLRLFRGLADRGAGFSIGLGIILTNFFSWLLALEWFTGDRRAAIARLVVLALASLISGAISLRQSRDGGLGVRRTAFLVPLVFALMGLVWLPHGIVSALVGLVLVATLSFAAWAGERESLGRQLRRNAVPLVAAHLLFLIGLLFFANVRSHIPWATYELGLYMAEKWGNYSHLNAIMISSSLPPRDVWFNGEYTNYYYGAHLLTATLAKATGTPLPVAFNLGLATIFGLTLSLGFTFGLSLVHLVTEKVSVSRRLIWHRGMAWGLLVAVAITLFGNLDAWRQFFTREPDFGARQRFEFNQRAAQPVPDADNAVAPEVVLALHASIAVVSAAEQPEALLGEIARQRDRGSRFEESRTAILSPVESIMADQGLPARGRADALLDALVPAPGQPLYRAAKGINPALFEEELVRLVIAGREQDAIAKVKALTPYEDPGKSLEPLRAELESRIEKALASPAVLALRDRWSSDLASQQAAQELIGVTDPQSEITTALATGRYGDVARLLDDCRERLKTHPSLDGEGLVLDGLIRAAEVGFRIDARALLVERLGPAPAPTTAQAPGELRYTWENFSQVDFWAPSRAIKSSASLGTDSGTITEFPYFSFILGDHHPHTCALPYTLLALGACLSLLRKGRGRRRSEGRYLVESAPELLAMAFLIGAVFPVNIWDSVVLAPIYGLVILYSRRGVVPSLWLRWVGFGGFSLLLPLLVAALANGGLTITPLFLNGKFIALAWLLMVPAVYLAIHLYSYRMRPALIGLIGLTASAAVIMVGALLFGGVDGKGALATGLRDALVWVVCVLVAALWTLRGDQPTARWWYGGGLVYLVTGMAALAVTLPFKLFFVSPLQPAAQMMASVLPPIPSHELTGARGAFWANFWRSSPVNPFAETLRTRMGEFFNHWGIFLVPIVALVLLRLFSVARTSREGRAFAMIAVAIAVAGLARLYLGFWPGALALGGVVLALWFAQARERAGEGAAWVLLAGGLFWIWFAEALHFDDDYSGDYERYNTVFKLYFPVWLIMAGMAVVALRELTGRLPWQLRTPAQLFGDMRFWLFVGAVGVGVPLLLGAMIPSAIAHLAFWLIWIPLAILVICCIPAAFSPEAPHRIGTAAAAILSRMTGRWPAALACAPFLVLGLYYPLAATSTRTREFFDWPLSAGSEWRSPQRKLFTDRTLDATVHLAEYDAYRQDWKAMQWVTRNTPKTARILELPAPDAYAKTGRIAAGAGRIGIINWKHHEEQWRGRGKPAYTHLKARYGPRIAISADLAGLMRQDWPAVGAEMNEEVQFRLRLAKSSERVRILRKMYPDAPYKTLLRLERRISGNDYTMSAVMDLILRDARSLYTEQDDRALRRLFADYGITHVVVGAMERDPAQFGPGIDERFRGLGFREVYNSGLAANLLPGEKSVDSPTIIYEVPATFPQAAKEEPRG